MSNRGAETARGPGEKARESQPEGAESGTVWQGRPVLGAFYPFFMTGGLTLATTVVVGLALPLPPWTLGILVPFIAAMFLLPLALRRAWRFTLTRDEVRSEFRLWVGRSRSAPLGEVTDVVVRQGVAGRGLGFGSVRLDTAGTAFPGVDFWGVESPFTVEKTARKVLEPHEER